MEQQPKPYHTRCAMSWISILGIDRVDMPTTRLRILQTLVARVRSSSSTIRLKTSIFRLGSSHALRPIHRSALSRCVLTEANLHC
jgi:hypothetical protein